MGRLPGREFRLTSAPQRRTWPAKAGLLGLALAPLPFIAICAWQLWTAATTQRILSFAKHRESWVSADAGWPFWGPVAVWSLIGLLALAVSVEFGLQAIIPRRPKAYRPDQDDDPANGPEQRATER